MDPSPKVQDSSRQNLQGYNGRRIQHCGNYKDLEKFVDCLPTDFGLALDFDRAEKIKKEVKVVVTLLAKPDFAVCFSPLYGWAVAKRNVDGASNMSESKFKEVFKRGRWLTVNLFPAKARMRCSQVADWIVCPTYMPCNPPFAMFCSSTSAQLPVIEALAFAAVKKRVENNHGKRFVILDTSMGKVWLPGAVECPDTQDSDPERVEMVNCPVNCLCGGNSYRTYEDPKVQFETPTSQDDTEFETEVISNSLENERDENVDANQGSGVEMKEDSAEPRGCDSSIASASATTMDGRRADVQVQSNEEHKLTVAAKAQPVSSSKKQEVEARSKKQEVLSSPAKFPHISLTVPQESMDITYYNSSPTVRGSRFPYSRPPLPEVDITVQEVLKILEPMMPKKEDPGNVAEPNNEEERIQSDSVPEYAPSSPPSVPSGDPSEDEDDHEDSDDEGYKEDSTKDDKEDSTDDDAYSQEGDEHPNHPDLPRGLERFLNERFG